MDYFKRTKIAIILSEPTVARENVIVLGWVRTRRDSANLVFLEINDGSTLNNLQIVIDDKNRFPDLAEVSQGASLRLVGKLKPVPERPHKIELHPRELSLIGPCPPEYPLQKKRHSFEYLREIAHLRPRTNAFGVMNRFRSKMSFAIHKFFQKRGFYYIHSPVITATDAEGAGEQFWVTTFDLNKVPRNEKGEVDFDIDFFG